MKTSESFFNSKNDRNSEEISEYRKKFNQILDENGIIECYVSNEVDLDIYDPLGKIVIDTTPLRSNGFGYDVCKKLKKVYYYPTKGFNNLPVRICIGYGVLDKTIYPKNYIRTKEGWKFIGS